ncbi:DNA/RNA nuclease SfsA [Oceanospirillum beijerinckii]|uniref:DNA/RNA nuclease SfsA n=1 Tax=Oceanospirillum beijerinckii TaxID=64976 RepID=UPI00041A3077|nr:DNA/RNA nuclease SfsA [Oceanospirillum beijerinckii]
MQWVSELKPATLIRRYKRFMADVLLEDGSEITLHCPNTGSMRNCMQEGWRVWYSDSGNPKRKYPCSWELTETPDGHRICVNTAQANKLVYEALQEGWIEELQGYDSIRPEVKYGSENSRIDFLLSHTDQQCYVEVKSVTLLEEDRGEGAGFFPDAVSQRGQKHLRELQEMVQQGHRAVLLFCVNHTGIEQVSPARHIDPTYTQALSEAMAAGVEVLAYRAQLDINYARLDQALTLLPESQW